MWNKEVIFKSQIIKMNRFNDNHQFLLVDEGELFLYNIFGDCGVRRL